MQIGVLSLQGDFAAHAAALAKLGHTPVLVRHPDHLAGIGGLILPGGESTTHIKLLEQSGLKPALIKFHEQSFPIFGTCAGLILIAEKIVPADQFCFGFLPVHVERNAYGSQKESFIDEVSIPEIGMPPLQCVFIRAPKIACVSSLVEVLASHHDRPILVRYKKILGATFHPELTDDLRVHSLFTQMCQATHH